MDPKREQNLIFIRKPQDVENEAEHILTLINPEFDFSAVRSAFCDTRNLFIGKYSGYHACNTRYHDLDHTVMVFLASARLVHAVSIQGRDFKEIDVVLCLIASLFHDAGFIQRISDREGTGAKYSIGHEMRSVEFMKENLEEKGYRGDLITDCANMILCTTLSVSPKEIDFRNEDIETLGKIVGTADLVAQIADRLYLEKLLYLYEEFEEAHVPGFDSEQDLLRKTEVFYRDISRRRINEDLGGLGGLMRLHFKSRWGIDRDLYEEYIRKNIDYLKVVLEQREQDYRMMLKRGGVVESLTTT
ncbi:MAG: HD domain-containing protein [Spirochaetes bacterium]|nr:HD domain-containing protein [Spirochaetota bacterium]